MDRWGKEGEIGGQDYGKEEQEGLLWYGASEGCHGNMKTRKRRGITQQQMEQWMGEIQARKGSISWSKLVTQQRLPAH